MRKFPKKPINLLRNCLYCLQKAEKLSRPYPVPAFTTTRRPKNIAPVSFLQKKVLK